VLISKVGQAKIADFGISKVLEASSMLANTSLGTPYYLSPEVCLGQGYDSKSDMWMLGCILFELVTLRRPFEGENLNQVVLKIVHTPYQQDLIRENLFAELVSVLLNKNAFLRASTRDILLIPEVASKVKEVNCKSPLKDESVKKPIKQNSILYMIE
jgi:NIMA (never in mitosis gene a)-related kinase